MATTHNMVIRQLLINVIKWSQCPGDNKECKIAE